MVSKIQRAPFWIATQLDPQIYYSGQKKNVTVDIFMRYRCTVWSCGIVRYRLWLDINVSRGFCALQAHLAWMSNQSWYRTLPLMEQFTYLMNISAVTNFFLARVVLPKKKQLLGLCIKSEHCSYHGILKNQAWLRFGAAMSEAVPPCQSCDIAW